MKSKILVVAEDSSSLGEIRHRWTRLGYRAYLFLYRSWLRRLLNRLKKEHQVTLLVGSNVIAEDDPACRGVKYVPYNTVADEVDYPHLALENKRLMGNWRRALVEAGFAERLTYGGLFLPEVLDIHLAIILGLEFMVYVEALKIVAYGENPEAVYVVSGASVPEQAARHLAQEQNLTLKMSSRFYPAFWHRRFFNRLYAQAEKAKIRAFLQEAESAPLPAATKPDRKGVLLTCCTPQQLRPVVPVARRLKESDAFEPLVVAMFGMRDELEKLSQAGVSWTYSPAYLPRQEAEQLCVEHQARLKQVWQEIRRSPTVRDSLTHEGVPLFDLFEDRLGMMMSQASLAALLYTEATCRLIERERPRLVTVISDRRYHERACALMARQRGVPTLLLTHATSLSQEINAYDLTDRVTVVGPKTRDDLIAKGLPSASIAVVGDPAIDFLFEPGAESWKERLCARLQLDPSTRLILLVSSYTTFRVPVQEKKALFTWTFQAAQQLDDVQIVVKAHPNENLPVLQEQMAAWGMDGLPLVQHVSIYELIQVADLVVMIASMAGLEAMALGRPVVAMWGAEADYNSYFPYGESGAVALVRRAEEALPVFRLLLDDAAARSRQIERGQELARRYMRPPDGHTTARIVELMTELVAAKNKPQEQARLNGRLAGSSTEG